MWYVLPAAVCRVWNWTNNLTFVAGHKTIMNVIRSLPICRSSQLNHSITWLITLWSQLRLSILYPGTVNSLLNQISVNQLEHSIIFLKLFQHSLQNSFQFSSFCYSHQQILLAPENILNITSCPGTIISSRPSQILNRLPNQFPLSAHYSITSPFISLSLTSHRPCSLCPAPCLQPIVSTHFQDPWSWRVKFEVSLAAFSSAPSPLPDQYHSPTPLQDFVKLPGTSVWTDTLVLQSLFTRFTTNFGLPNPTLNSVCSFHSHLRPSIITQHSPVQTLQSQHTTMPKPSECRIFSVTLFPSDQPHFNLAPSSCNKSPLPLNGIFM